MNKLTCALGFLLITATLGLPQQDYEYTDYDATNSEGGEDEDADRTEVKDELPIFETHHPKLIRVQEGDNVSIACQTKKPTSHILIFKKETKLPDETKQTLLYVGEMKVDRKTKFSYKDNVFTLSKVRREYAGTYVCHYQANPSNELVYQLDVQYAPSVTTKTPDEQRVQKGKSVTIGCQTRGNPMPVIKWSKVAGRLPSGSEEEEGYSMTLENVDRHVEGTYICSAENGIGKPATASMKLIVEYPPEITTEKAIVRTGEGDKVELVCIVHARPAASVVWTKDGVPLQGDGNIQETDGGHRHSISIFEVTEQEFGSYQCEARNEKGDSRAIINLTDLPKKPLFTSAATSAEETSYTLAWETESYYPITEYKVQYRLARANNTTNTPGEWTELTVEVDEEDVDTEGLIHNMKHTIDDLLPATDYQAIVSVKNKNKWGDEGRFNFSTRKEQVSWRKTSGTTSTAINIVALAISALFLSVVS